jgi:ketosteroid isomerase-like protein
VGEQRVETIRGIYDEWARGNFRAGVELFDPHVVFVEGVGPDGGVYVGVEAVKSFMRGFLGAWAQVTIEAQELIPAGDTVVVHARQHATGTAEGVPGDGQYFQVWTFRGDRVIRLDNVPDRERALAATAPVR